ncbi:hypothetical protein LRR18_18760, partial [Mangrovimonas sp. AS39]|nr:hypothetical protein [Mangrovimonas futianensis]
KVKKIADVIANTPKVPCMIGNGFNDTLAFKKSAVAIATFAAHDSAKEAANIQLTTADLNAVPRAYNLSRALVHRLTWIARGSVFYNLVTITFA